MPQGKYWYCRRARPKSRYLFGKYFPMGERSVNELAFMKRKKVYLALSFNQQKVNNLKSQH